MKDKYSGAGVLQADLGEVLALIILYSTLRSPLPS